MGKPNPAPGFVNHPSHKVSLSTERKHVVLGFGGEIIADSRNALVVAEGEYPPRYYIPKADIRMDLLEPTDNETHCPFKGDARYWTIKAGEHVLENGAWAYEDPFDETSGLAGLVSFYTENMTLEIVDDSKSVA